MNGTSNERRRPRGAVLTLALLAGVTAGRLPAQTPTPTTAGQAPIRVTLGEAARLAARQSASALAAGLQTEQAVARVRQSRGALLPEFSGGVGGSRRTINTASFGIDFPSPPGQPPTFTPGGEVLGPVNLIDIRARLEQELFDPAAYQRVRSARAVAGVASAAARSAGETSANSAANAYLRVLRADAQLQARQADSALAQELLGIAQQQLTAGVGVGLDVTRAQAQVAQVRAQLIAARNDRDRSRLDLRRAVGLAADAQVEPADSLARLSVNDSAGNEAELIERALRTRPDLRVAERQQAAARTAVSAIRAERLPSVGLVADDGVLGLRTSRLLPTYNVGVQVTVPVFDGLRREGRIEEQEAAAREAEVRRRDLELQAASDVRGALLDLGSAREQVAASQERLRLAEQEVSQARERFQAGVAGNADVITASLNLTGARTTLVDALASYQNARVALARSTGSVTTLP